MLDDPAVWPAVVAAAVDSGVAPKGEEQAAGRLGAHLDAPVSDLARALVLHEFSPGRDSFQHQVEAILDSPGACPPQPSVREEDDPDHVH